MEWTLSSQNQYWSGDDRHSADGRRDRPKSVGPMTDLSCPEVERGSPVQMQSLREFEQRSAFKAVLTVETIQTPYQSDSNQT
ncbi:unnamed protein product [Gadus morhua 'NCC']